VATQCRVAQHFLYRSRTPGSGYEIDAMGLITNDYEGGWAPAIPIK